MTAGKDDAEVDVVATGRSVNQSRRERMETTDKGIFLVIHSVSGNYEVDPSAAAAKHRLKARQPEAELYERRIGRQLSYKAVAIRRAGDIDET